MRLVRTCALVVALCFAVASLGLASSYGPSNGAGAGAGHHANAGANICFTCGGYVGWYYSSFANAYTNGDWEFGNIFSPTANITLVQLGYWNSGQTYPPSYTSSHWVGIYNAAGTLLDATTINNSSSFTNGGEFMFNNVTPLKLIAGQTYVIDSVSGTDNYTWNTSGFTTQDVNWLGDNWCSISLGVCAANSFTGTGNIGDVSNGYFGGNFAFVTATTPEPGSLMLLGTGLLGLGGVIRRRFGR